MTNTQESLKCETCQCTPRVMTFQNDLSGVSLFTVCCDACGLASFPEKSPQAALDNWKAYNDTLREAKDRYNVSGEESDLTAVHLIKAEMHGFMTVFKESCDSVRGKPVSIKQVHVV